MSEHNPRHQAIAERWCRNNGQTLVGHVGSGAFKSVFQIKNSNNDSYALKIFTISEGRTEREIEAGKRCHHPNIARMLHTETVEDGSDTFVVIQEEFISGGTLDALLKDETIDAAELVLLSRPLISCLDHLRQLRLVHRDIKPANILLRDGISDPVITDFGLVRDLDASSLTADFLDTGPGTPYYAPPEQLNNEKSLIDWRSDQYSLGVTLTIARFGVHPYEQEGDDKRTTFLRAKAREQQSEKFYSNIGGTEHPLARMTRPWPIQRYNSIDELNRDWDQQIGN